MKKHLLFALLLPAFLSSCNSNQESGSDTQEAPVQTGSYQGEFFGEAFDLTDLISVDELIPQMAGADSLAVQLTGTVSEVCQMKGCWMNIQPENEDHDAIMVRFKDYGFFVPKDIAGRQILMKGYAFKEVTPLEELRHYAEDAGKSAEEIAAITESKEEIKFLASGVFLLEE